MSQVKMTKRPTKANAKSQEQILRTNNRAPTAKEVPEPTSTRDWLEHPFPETHRKPTPEELDVLNRFVARRGSTPRVNLSLDPSAEEAGNVLFKYDYDDERIARILLMDAVGTADMHFCRGLIRSLIVANMIDNQFDKDGFDSTLSVVKGLKPRDQLEAMLGAQMAAVHSATMRFAGRLSSALSIPEMETAHRVFAKLARTFASQIDTLKRYRLDGPHTVQNVSVGDGGQALVANVTNSASESTRSQTVVPEPSPANANGHANGFSARPTERVSLRSSKECPPARAGRH